ncbi:hypothetical protein A5662_17675 [Mycobacteriaceae bacterium 1482268.1]|nr:hypothetical protein A5662_17675 [Mycobacteriaceae bacterium 1482268.1]
MELSCPACSASGRPKSLVVEGRYRLNRCSACATEFFRPDPELGGSADERTISEYWESYKFDVYGSTVVRDAFAARYDRVLAEARQHVTPIHSVLDVGCGIGNFLDHAGKVGLEAIGSDVEARAVNASRERGLTAYLANELDEHVPDESVDAVSMWDVIEHLFDPVSVLRAGVAKLRPGGALLIETPDAAFLGRRMLLAIHSLSAGRVNLTAPMYYWEHKVYFTERGLSILLERTGIEVLSVHRETSLREKMAVDFKQHSDQSLIGHFLYRAWPAMETTFRQLGRGNKLIVVGCKRGG